MSKQQSPWQRSSSRICGTLLSLCLMLVTDRWAQGSHSHQHCPVLSQKQQQQQHLAGQLVPLAAAAAEAVCKPLPWHRQVPRKQAS